jgi:hypothetical protein
MRLSSLTDGPISVALGQEFDGLKSHINLLRGFEAISPELDHNSTFALSGMSDCFGGRALPAPAERCASIDQHIRSVLYDANTVRRMDVMSINVTWDSTRPSISFGVDASGNLIRTRSFSEPRALWQQLFGDVGGVTPADRQKDQLVQDRILDHYRAVITNPRLASEDKRKLDAHLARINERRILTGANGCAVPGQPSVVFGQAPGNLGATLDAFVDLIVAAFACDLTRAVVFEIDPDVLWRQIDPYREGYHDLSLQHPEPRHEGERRWRWGRSDRESSHRSRAVRRDFGSAVG